MIVNKIEYIRAYAQIGFKNDRSNTIQALINCLSVQESCIMLESSLFEADLRRHLLKRIYNDIEFSFQPIHQVLCQNLIEKLINDKTKKRDTYGYVLDQLFGVLTTELRDEILQIFVKSKLRNLRNRGYKILLNNWLPEYSIIVYENWLEQRDYYSEKLLIEYVNEDLLIDSVEKIIPFLDPISISKMFIRLIPVQDSLVNLLKEVDDIAYLYVMAKLNRPVTDDNANFIITNYYNDQRIGLIVWCLGKLNMWNSIVFFIENYRDKVEFDDFGNVAIRDNKAL